MAQTAKDATAALEEQETASGGGGTAAVNTKTALDNPQPQQPKPAIPTKPAVSTKPTVVSSTQPYIPQFQLQTATQTAARPTVVTVKLVDTKQLQEFLNHVAWARQDEAEAMLKVNKDLALASGDVTDHAKRTFKNIAGLQMAVWNLDWKMWTMILLYLPKDAAIDQAKGFKTGAWVKEHGEHATWTKLIDALQVYIDKHLSWDDTQCIKHWVNEVGNGGQFPSPMHVLQEYCNPGRPFEPCPNFSTEYTLQRKLPDWLSSAINKGKFDFGLLRNNFTEAGDGGMGVEVLERVPWCCLVSGCYAMAGYPALSDRSALISLYHTRAQQRVELIASLSNELRQTTMANKK